MTGDLGLGTQIGLDSYDNLLVAKDTQPTIGPFLGNTLTVSFLLLFFRRFWNAPTTTQGLSLETTEER